MSDRAAPRLSARPPTGASEWAPRWAAVGLALALAAVIAWSTPWHLIDLPAPNTALDFTPAEIARQDKYRHDLLPWTTTSWALSVLVPLVLGFTPVGRRLYIV